MLNTAASDSSTAPGAADFAAGLQAEREALGAFIELLRAEQDVLVHGDAERLAALAPDKATQLDLLTRLGARRKRHLAAQKLADNADGMRSWLSRHREVAGVVTKIWQDLLARTETARQLNQSNGLLIENKLLHIRGKLAVLQTAAASEGVYRQDGQLRGLRGARYRDRA